MHKPITIVGHGITGCAMAMTLWRKQIPFRIIGASLPGEASKVSCGLIAPVTGRRYVKAWNIEMYIDFAKEFYRWTEELVGRAFFEEIEIVRFLSNAEAAKAWEQRSADPEYKKYISNKTYEVVDRFNKPYGILTGGYRLDTPAWLDAIRAFLLENDRLKIVEDPVALKTPEEGIIILATGAMDENFAYGVIPNKGEALIVRMPEWKIPLVVKDEIFIVPLYEDVYWVGSYYEPGSNNPDPSDEGKKQILNALANCYSGPIEIKDHLAGVRPTVDDRRPLIGEFPGRPNVYLFNGMGTKATSLAPYWADQLVGHILHGISLPNQVLPSRY